MTLTNVLGALFGITLAGVVTSEGNHRAFHNEQVAAPSIGNKNKNQTGPISWAQAYDAAATLAAVSDRMDKTVCRDSDLDATACDDPIKIVCEKVTQEHVDSNTYDPCPHGLTALDKCLCLVKNQLKAVQNMYGAAYTENINYKRKTLQLNGCLQDLEGARGKIIEAYKLDVTEMNTAISEELDRLVDEAQTFKDAVGGSSLTQAVKRLLLVADAEKSHRQGPVDGALLSHEMDIKKSVIDKKQMDDIREKVLKSMTIDMSHVLQVVNATHQGGSWRGSCTQLTDSTDSLINTGPKSDYVEPSPKRPAWSPIWSSLIHQSTVRPAQQKFLTDFKDLLKDLFSEIS